MKHKLSSFSILTVVFGFAVAVFVFSLFSPQHLLTTINAQDSSEAQEDFQDDDDGDDYDIEETINAQDSSEAQEDFQDDDDGDDYDIEEVESAYCYPQYEFDHFECTGTKVCGGRLIEIWCDVECNEGCEERNAQDCGLAQVCNAEVGSCECSASECYLAPELKDIKDTTLFPQNVFESSARDGSQANPNKLKLPVNLGWNDVNEWAQVNSIPQDECTVESYNYEIFNANGDKVFEQHIASPSTSPLEERILQDVARGTQNNKEQCSVFLSNEAYGWRVQDCLGEEGDDCSDWSNTSSFVVSSAPELKSPYDPDWESEIESAKAKIPVTLEWCQTPSTNAWRIKFYEGLPLLQEGDPIKEFILSLSFPEKTTIYSDRDLLGILNKNVTYFWEILSCTNQAQDSCKQIKSQMWTVLPIDAPLAKPFLRTPSDGGTVNKQDKLTWRIDPFVQKYLIWIEKIPKTGENLAQDPFRISRYYSFNPELSVNSLHGWENDRTYEWKIAPCWGALPDISGPTDTDIENQIKNICETTDAGNVKWSDTHTFKTTGAPPTNLRIRKEGKDSSTGKASIPLLLDWSVPGAASYVYEIASGSKIASGILERPGISPDYPQIESDKTYQVMVKTCAEKRGKTCGDWAKLDITTADLASQQISSPQQGTEQSLSIAVSANQVFGARFYKYILKYLTPEDKETAICKAKVGKNQTTIVQDSTTTIKAACIGEYQIQTQACIDKECKDAGTLSDPVTFQITEPTGPTFGLVPCGADRNFTNTPSDDRHPCEAKHLLLVLHNIIDFMLWKFTLVIVVIMTAITGVVLLFSFGGPEVLTKIKTIWKAVGLGTLILLFAWFFLNLLLGIVGFNVGVFGNWYMIPI